MGDRQATRGFDRDRSAMKRYSAFAIAREAMRDHLGWERAWAKRAPKKRYDVIIVVWFDFEVDINATRSLRGVVFVPGINISKLVESRD